MVWRFIRTYQQELGKCCSQRLGSFRKWVGVAALRSLETKSVPEELQAESLNCKSTSWLLQLYDIAESPTLSVLIVRVLYRLRSLAEQAPFDAATFVYAFPLLDRIIVQGGVAVQGNDDSLEQVTLSLDIIKFHCDKCQNHISYISCELTR